MAHAGEGQALLASGRVQVTLDRPQAEEFAILQRDAALTVRAEIKDDRGFEYLC